MLGGFDPSNTKLGLGLEANGRIMVTFTCPRCTSRRQIDSLLNYESVTCGNCQQQVRWSEVVDLAGEVLCNCVHCGTKLRINQNTLEGSCECCVCKKSFLIRLAPNLVGPGIQPLHNFKEIISLLGDEKEKFLDNLKRDVKIHVEGKTTPDCLELVTRRANGDIHKRWPAKNIFSYTPRLIAFLNPFVEPENRTYDGYIRTDLRIIPL